jgi:hypothetical protein
VDAGVNATALVIPPDHEYEVAPVPLSVTEDPVQTVVDGAAVNETVGRGFTVTVIVFVPVQPARSVPVTVYVCVDAGVNGTPSVTPPVHEYVDAPEPVSVTELPAQTEVDGAAVELTVGSGFTLRVAVAVFVQPFTSVPVTV